MKFEIRFLASCRDETSAARARLLFILLRLSRRQPHQRACVRACSYFDEFLGVYVQRADPADPCRGFCGVYERETFGLSLSIFLLEAERGGCVGGATVAPPPPLSEQLTQGPQCRHEGSVESVSAPPPRHCATICVEWEGVATPNRIIHQKAKSGGESV